MILFNISLSAVYFSRHPIQAALTLISYPANLAWCAAPKVPIHYPTIAFIYDYMYTIQVL